MSTESSKKRKRANGGSKEISQSSERQKKQPRNDPSSRNDTNTANDDGQQDRIAASVQKGNKKIIDSSSLTTRKMLRQTRTSNGNNDSDHSRKISYTNGHSSSITRGADRKNLALNQIEIAVETNKGVSQDKLSQNRKTSTTNSIIEQPALRVTERQSRSAPDEEENQDPECSPARNEEKEDSCLLDNNIQYKEDTFIQSTCKETNDAKERPWIYYTIQLCVLFILIIASISAYQSFLTSQWIEGSISAELQEKQMSLNLLERKLNSTQAALDRKEDENKHCQQNLQVTQLNNEKLNQDMQLLKKRLEFVVGEEDSIQSSLTKALDQIEELQIEKSEKSIQLESTTAELLVQREAKSSLELEQRTCSDRVVELELEALGADDTVARCESRVKQEILGKNDLEDKLNEQQDLAALLQHQLDEENGHTWYYELQMDYLEGIINELEGTVVDFKFEKTTMETEIRRLRNQILVQNDEAVAALNAVAKSATYRKAEQFAMVDAAANRKVESAKEEAVNAVNSVLAAAMSRD